MICDDGAASPACLVCRQTFIPKQRHVKCCGTACAAIQARRTRTENAEKRRHRVCEICATSFLMHPPSGRAISGLVNEGRFCSRTCRNAWQRKPAPVAPEVRARSVCLICGKQEAAAWSQYCSSDCRKENARRRSRERAASTATRAGRRHKCKMCGATFQPIYGNKRRAFCSADCVRRHARATKKPRKRARQFGVRYEPISPLAVFQRDGWRCQICGARTPKRLRGSLSDVAPEVDHRIPLALGGGHTSDNVQCACRKCNLAKGARRAMGQMHLFPAAA